MIGLHRGPKLHEAVADMPTTLICGTNLTGYPIVTVEWMDNNGTKITSKTQGFTLNNRPDVLSLTIAETAVADSGQWLCVLKTDEGEVKIDIQLSVQVGGTL